MDPDSINVRAYPDVALDMIVSYYGEDMIVDWLERRIDYMTRFEVESFEVVDKTSRWRRVLKGLIRYSWHPDGLEKVDG